MGLYGGNSTYGKHLLLSFLLLTLCLQLFVPRQLSAQSEGESNYLDSINSDEDGGKLAYPSFVLAEPVMNEIYVIDSMVRIIIYSSDLFPLYTLSKRNGIESPQGLAVDEKGDVYVAQALSKSDPKNRISVFNACLNWEQNIYFEGFEGADSFMPYRIAIDKNGLIYVAGLHFPGVIVLDKNGKFLDIMSPEEGDKKARLNNVMIDRKGKIYLLSEEESRIYVYDENRKFLFKFGEKGGNAGKLSRPKGIAVDYNVGKMYVVDYMRHTVNIYDMDGKYISEFGGMGWTEGWFQHPTDITIDSKGRLFVSDTFNDRIQVFKSM
ncbi:MAG: NHL repeat-containing protein [Nitrospirae bacterium]|nr:NHL repeat-containing protein [Nitrospirota bacterium]MCL5236802.1 NHL repeat-containing protein [Nitrospirota bacterium]